MPSAPEQNHRRIGLALKGSAIGGRRAARHHRAETASGRRPRSDLWRNAVRRRLLGGAWPPFAARRCRIVEAPASVTVLTATIAVAAPPEQRREAPRQPTSGRRSPGDAAR